MQVRARTDKGLIRQTETTRHLELASPSRDYKPSSQHKTAWEIEPGIELSPDMLPAP